MNDLSDILSEALRGTRAIGSVTLSLAFRFVRNMSRQFSVAAKELKYTVS